VAVVDLQQTTLNNMQKVSSHIGIIQNTVRQNADSMKTEFAESSKTGKIDVQQIVNALHLRHDNAALERQRLKETVMPRFKSLLESHASHGKALHGNQLALDGIKDRITTFDSEVKHGFKQAENRMVNNLASIKAAVAVGSKQNNKAITLVGDMVTTIPDGQRELQRELSITISKVEDGLARMFMGREQAKLSPDNQEQQSPQSENSVKSDLKIIGDTEDDWASDGLANFKWDSSDTVTVAGEIPATKTAADGATPTFAATDNTPATEEYSVGVQYTIAN